MRLKKPHFYLFIDNLILINRKVKRGFLSFATTQTTNQQTTNNEKNNCSSGHDFSDRHRSVPLAGTIQSEQNQLTRIDEAHRTQR